VRAEEIIAAQLELRLGSLALGRRHRLVLDEPIIDPTTHRPRPGPHVAGWIERPTPGELRIGLVDTEAGRTARALLEEEIIDVVVGHGYPPTIRLTA
jgi:hypothetical protein